MSMDIRVFPDKPAMARAAAEQAAAGLRQTIAERGAVRIIAATGASQFDFLERLVTLPGIDWSRTVFFHLDEYVGLPDTHPASFRRYLRERIVERVRPGAFHFVAGDAPDPAAECRRVGALLAAQPIDLAFVGIGENGHLAFNDPPADFDTDEPYLVVELDEDCRRQQLGEGWFPRLEDVPERAISMSIRQIMKSRAILGVVPDARKARAVKACLEGEVSPQHPASILQRHPRATVFLDGPAAALLERPRAAR
jgi:glucosamine-6-phosphate deaminase